MNRSINVKQEICNLTILYSFRMKVPTLLKVLGMAFGSDALLKLADHYLKVQNLCWNCLIMNCSTNFSVLLFIHL